MGKKQDIRKDLLQKRNTLSEQIHEKYSTLIEEQLFCLQQYKQADSILIYASYQSEVSTYGIISKSFEDQKKVFCPKVLGPGYMEFYEIASLRDIVAGYKNIPEPVTLQLPYEKWNGKNILMIMPLVGFDENKNRLGYGGGFYDRYLQRFSNIQTIALGFEVQKLEISIPTEETDIKPDFILTEKNFY